MTFDGLFTHAMVQELNRDLKGGKIAKVYQPYENEIILRIRANRQNQNLLLSAHSQYARIQISQQDFTNPQEPPHFCMILRKYLENGVLQSINQVENDRVVHFNIASRNELGDQMDIILVVEIMGRHSNIILLDQSNNTIINSIKHISPSQNSYRTILPNSPYKPAPSQNKVNPYDFSEIDQVLMESKKASQKAIQDNLQGFSRQAAKELAERLDRASDFNQTYQDFIQAFDLAGLQPSLYQLDQGKEKFTAFPYSSLAGDRKDYRTLSQLLDRFYDQKAERDRTHQLASDLFSLVNNELKKNSKKLDKIIKEQEESQAADSYRVKGEVLTAYLHKVQQGMSSIKLDNFYEEGQIEIDLDPQKSPADNAQAYFSRYQKMKTRQKKLKQQIQSTRQEMDYLESVLAQLDVVSQDDIEEVRDELRSQGYLKAQTKKKKGKKQKKSKPFHFKASDGTDILVGRNNTQNDELTGRIANKNDWWLHTQNIPGSHVIVRSANPSDQTLEEAAMLAAYYSKYRESASVPVDTVQVKYVNKPNGAKPGFVTYEGQTTYFVTPSKDKVQKLAVK